MHPLTPLRYVRGSELRCVRGSAPPTQRVFERSKRPRPAPGRPLTPLRCVPGSDFPQPSSLLDASW
jgi:hypothetical protein